MAYLQWPTVYLVTHTQFMYRPMFPEQNKVFYVKTFCTINEGKASRSDDATYQRPHVRINWCLHVRITQSINSCSSVLCDLDAIYLHELIPKERLHKDRMNGLLQMRDFATFYHMPPVAVWFPLRKNLENVLFVSIDRYNRELLQTRWGSYPHRY